MSKKILKVISPVAIETREYQDDDGNTKPSRYKISGKAIVFNTVENVGGFFEEIKTGALDNTDMRDVPLYVNHSTQSIPLARSRNNNENSTLQLKVKDDGLYVDAYLDVEGNSEAAAVYSAVKRGDIDGMSFSFAVELDEWSEYNDSGVPQKRTIYSISKLYEVSVVNYPAYESTTVEAREYQSYLLESRSEAIRERLDSQKSEELKEAKAQALLEVKRELALVQLKKVKEV